MNFLDPPMDKIAYMLMALRIARIVLRKDTCLIHGNRITR